MSSKLTCCANEEDVLLFQLDSSCARKVCCTSPQFSHVVHFCFNLNIPACRGKQGATIEVVEMGESELAHKYAQVRIVVK